MGEDPSAGGPPGAAVTTQAPERTDTDTATLRVEIERTRLALGDTVEALAGKTDVKARAKGKAAEVRRTVSDKLGRARESGPDGRSAAVGQVRAKAQANPVPTAAVAALVGGFVLGRITKRR
jgi:hypothetical protein